MMNSRPKALTLANPPSDSPQSELKGYHAVFYPLRQIVLQYMDTEIIFAIVDDKENNTANGASQFITFDINTDFIKKLANDRKPAYFAARLASINLFGERLATSWFSLVIKKDEDKESRYQHALKYQDDQIYQFVSKELAKAKLDIAVAAMQTKISVDEFSGLLAVATDLLTTHKMAPDTNHFYERCLKAIENQGDHSLAKFLDIFFPQGSLAHKKYNENDLIKRTCDFLVNSERYDTLDILLTSPELSMDQRINLAIEVINVFRRNKNMTLLRKTLLTFFSLTDSSFAEEKNPEETRFNPATHLKRYDASAWPDLITQTDKMIANRDLSALQCVIWSVMTDDTQLDVIRTLASQLGIERLLYDDTRNILNSMKVISAYLDTYSHIDNPDNPQYLFALLPLCLSTGRGLHELTFGNYHYNYFYLTPILMQHDYTSLIDIASTQPADNPFKKVIMDAAAESKSFPKAEQNALIKARVLDQFETFSSIDMRREIINCYLLLAEIAPKATKAGLERQCIEYYLKEDYQKFLFIRQYAIANTKVELTLSASSFFYKNRLDQFLARITEIPLHQTEPLKAIQQITMHAMKTLYPADRLYKSLYFHFGRWGSGFHFEIKPVDYHVSDIESESRAWKNLIEQEAKENADNYKP